MNKKQQTQQIVNNNIRNLLDPMQKLVYMPNIAINTGNLLTHELAKVKICYELFKEGNHTIVTEAKLKTGGRPDILVLDLQNPIAYEVMVSESEKSITEKEAKYHGITIVKVRVDND